MTEPSDIRRKRLRFRAWHRGTKEADLVIGRFADRHLDEFDETELDQFEVLLEQNDADVMDWFTGKAQVDAEADNPVTRRLLAFDAAIRTL